MSTTAGPVAGGLGVLDQGAQGLLERLEWVGHSLTPVLRTRTLTDAAIH